MVISDEAGRALYGACVTRGKAKGLLKRNAPPDRLSRAAWYGAQSVCNRYGWTGRQPCFSCQIVAHGRC